MTEHLLGEDLAAMAEGGKGLSPARKEELDAHLAGGCATCRDAIRSAQLVLRTVDANVPDAPAQAFDAKLFQKLDAIDRETRAPAKSATFADRLRATTWFTLPRFVAIGAATAALVLALVFTRPPPGPGEEPPEVVETASLLAVAEDLDLYQEMDVVEDLDVLEDLDVINEMDDAG